jgi:hypothetical protein
MTAIRFRVFGGLLLASLLSCQGLRPLAPGTLKVAPPSYDFGSVLVGSVGVASLQVSNVGTGPLTVQSLALQAADSTIVISDVLTLDCNGAPRTGSELMMLESGECAAFTVRYEPQAAGTMSNAIVVTALNATNPTVQIPIMGQAPAPKLCVSPAALSFGALPVKTSETLELVISNCGGVNYDLTQLALTDSSGGAFAIAAPVGSIPTLPDEFDVGATLTLDVTFTPGSEGSFTGSLVAAAGSGSTVFQTVTVPLTGAAITTECTRTNLTPTAAITVKDGSTVVDPTTTVLPPLTQLTLDASDSIVPTGSGETITSYSWTLVVQPPGSTTSLSASDSAQPGLFVEIIGDYVVELVVGTNKAATSCPVVVTLHVNSTAGIHVQLTWPQNYGDMDLHYIGPGGSFYEEYPYAGDLYWRLSLATAVGPVTPTPNCGVPETPLPCTALYPNWGGNPGVAPGDNPWEDPSLDVDQRWGNGPENATQNSPFDGTYTIAAHYYCSFADEDPFGDNGPSAGYTTAQIKIFVRGVLTWSGEMPGMGDDQVWEAAQIVVSDNGQTVTVNPLTSPPYYGGKGCITDVGGP